MPGYTEGSDWVAQRCRTLAELIETGAPSAIVALEWGELLVAWDGRRAARRDNEPPPVVTAIDVGRLAHHVDQVEAEFDSEDLPAVEVDKAAGCSVNDHTEDVLTELHARGSCSVEEHAEGETWSVSLVSPGDPWPQVGVLVQVDGAADEMTWHIGEQAAQAAAARAEAALRDCSQATA